jgi:hypothetical protein
MLHQVRHLEAGAAVTDPLTTKYDDALTHRAATDIMGWHLRVVDRDAEAYGAPVRTWFDKDGIRKAWADSFIDTQAFNPFEDTADACLLLRGLYGNCHLVRLLLDKEIKWELWLERKEATHLMIATGKAPDMPQAARQIVEAFFRSHEPNQPKPVPEQV